MPITFGNPTKRKVRTSLVESEKNLTQFNGLTGPFHHGVFQHSLKLVPSISPMKRKKKKDEKHFFS